MTLAHCLIGKLGPECSPRAVSHGSSHMCTYKRDKEADIHPDTHKHKHVHICNRLHKRARTHHKGRHLLSHMYRGTRSYCRRAHTCTDTHFFTLVVNQANLNAKQECVSGVNCELAADILFSGGAQQGKTKIDVHVCVFEAEFTLLSLSGLLALSCNDKILIYFEIFLCTSDFQV